MKFWLVTFILLIIVAVRNCGDEPPIRSPLFPDDEYESK